MEVRASIKLQNDFTSYFQRNIMREITAKLNRNATQIQASIETQVKGAVRNLLFGSPEVSELMGGVYKLNWV